MNKDLYIAFSNVFQYPSEQYKQHVQACSELLKTTSQDAHAHFEKFVRYIEKHSIYEIEEVFAKTFHIQAICYLDIGYVLFGEDYKRGEFLVQMKKELNNHGIDYGNELPDNLPFVLQLLTCSKDQKFIEEYTSNAVLPAIEKMLVEFGQSRIDFRNRIMKRKYKIVIQQELTAEEVNLYEHALRSLQTVLQADFGHIEPFKKEEEDAFFSKSDNLSNFLQQPPSSGCTFQNYNKPISNELPKI